MSTEIPNGIANATPAPITFSINAQYIKDLSFEGPAHPSDVISPNPPSIDVQVSAETRPLEMNVFEVVLKTRATATVENKHAFLVELAYAGIISVPPGLDEEGLKYLLLVEVARQLFPFARNIIANATRDGGFPPLLLQPIDFTALYRQQMGNVTLPKAKPPEEVA
ncbi:MAG: protein-export chaperone SecB [Alphaproteobacteria bacterium]|nr:protein-export chaperone SecB [Alphaproteobacteria bacterium]